jgi:hypothetical protein
MERYPDERAQINSRITRKVRTYTIIAVAIVMNMIRTPDRVGEKIV